MRTITHKTNHKTTKLQCSIEQYANERGSNLEILFERLWKSLGDPSRLPEREYIFAHPRKFRFDFAWPSLKIAVEIDGDTRGSPVICHNCRSKVRAVAKNGTIGRELRLGGRHSRGDGFQSDSEKQNLATCLGWSVLRLTADDLTSRPTHTIDLLNRLIDSKQPHT